MSGKNGKKSPREIAWDLELDVIATVHENGDTARFLVWTEDVLQNDVYHSVRMPEYAYTFCLGKEPEVGLVHGQECLIYTEV